MITGHLTQLPQMLLFTIICAFVVAKLEIQIEGKDGWAKNLPAWKIHNKITKIFFGTQPLTGYHIWMIITLLWFLQIPFFIGVSWSLWFELQIVGLFWLAVLIEDFLWFVLNPYYGIKKFRKGKIEWHENWLLGVPKIYFSYLVLTTTLLIISLFV